MKFPFLQLLALGQFKIVIAEATKPLEEKSLFFWPEEQKDRVQGNQAHWKVGGGQFEKDRIRQEHPKLSRQHLNHVCETWVQSSYVKDKD